MKEYKVIDVGTAEDLERALNEAAGEGWEVASSQLVHYPLTPSNRRYFAVLVRVKARRL